MSEPFDKPELVATFVTVGRRVSGIVVSATEHAFELRLPVGAGRVVPLGRESKLMLVGGSMEDSLDVVATSVFWRESAEHDSVRFSASDSDLGEIRAALRSERAAIRVPVRGRRALRAQLESTAGDFSIEAGIVDVSASGMGVIVGVKDDMRLAALLSHQTEGAVWRVKLTFHMPGNDAPMNVVAALRYRSFKQPFVKYGLRFDDESTRAAFPDQVQTVEQHLIGYEQAGRDAA